MLFLVHIKITNSLVEMTNLIPCYFDRRMWRCTSHSIICFYCAHTSEIFWYMYTYSAISKLMWQTQVENKYYSTVSGLIQLVTSLECFIEITPDFLCPFMNDRTTCTVNFRATATGSL